MLVFLFIVQWFRIEIYNGFFPACAVAGWFWDEPASGV